MFKHLGMVLLAALPFCGYAQDHQQIHQDLEARAKSIKSWDPQVILQQAKNEEERKALEFLLAYMDMADIMDYSPSYWIDNVRAALRTRHETAWGRKVPYREWLHFVLPVRINNEALDDFRSQYYDELQERVKGMTWKEAALEVNHWLHEHASYRPSDSRTSSPLATIRTATGRCGEESTLGVAAYRAVGIPARQVYTPRWAHTDDNHAWVEVFVDGKWHFLGACEPAPILDMAWFNAPAHRGMLMNTTVLGKYDGREQVLRRTPTSTTINVTDNYAPTLEQKVRVVDEEGNAVEGARVRFGLYNYAELYPIYVATSSSNGEASLITGKGDLVVWAEKDGVYGLSHVKPMEGKVQQVVLEHRKGESWSAELMLTPPPADNSLPQVTPEQETANNDRMAEEDNIRNAYIQSWISDAQIEALAQRWHCSEQQLSRLFHQSEGNYKALEHFLAQNIGTDDTAYAVGDTILSRKDWALLCLESLTKKDLRDFDEGVLQQQLDAFLTTAPKMALKGIPFDVVCRYVLCPRISVEELTPWRLHLRAVKSKGKTVEQKVNKWLKFLNEKVVTDTLARSPYFAASPQTVVRYRLGGKHAKGQTFVALCRTYGVPARFDFVTSTYQYYDHGKWINVPFGKVSEKVQAAISRLQLAYTPHKFMPDPQYYRHFTVSKINGGMPQLMAYPEDYTWEKPFKAGVEVEKGDYMLVSGMRLANGSVLAEIEVFPVSNDTIVPLIIREDNAAVSVIGSLNAEDLYYDVATKTTKSLLSTTGRGYYALAVLKANNEPSTHILHDIEAVAKEFEAWGRPIMILFASKQDYAWFESHRSEFAHLPSNIHFGIDESGAVAGELCKSPLTDSKELPVVVIADTFNRVVFFRQGYTIGVGQTIIDTLGKM